VEGRGGEPSREKRGVYMGRIDGHLILYSLHTGLLDNYIF
jgi:hypothetical protein